MKTDHNSTNKSFLVFFLFLCIFFLIPNQILAWGGDNHRVITRAAVELLPEQDRQMLGPAIDSLVESYCLYPDWYRSALRDDNKENIARYKPYVQLPLLQDLGVWHKNYDNESEISFYIASFLIHKAAENLKAGDTLEAGQYIGPLVHFIEDNACPVHVVDNNLLAQLAPAPDSLKPFRLHQAVERPTFKIAKAEYNVSLLGDNVIEAATAFYPRFLANRLAGRAQAIPILEALYAKNKELADRGRAASAIPAAQLVADVIHTICELAVN